MFDFYEGCRCPDGQCQECRLSRTLKVVCSALLALVVGVFIGVLTR